MTDSPTSLFTRHRACAPTIRLPDPPPSPAHRRGFLARAFTAIAAALLFPSVHHERPHLS